MRRIILGIILIFISTGISRGQNTPKDTIQVLKVLFNRLVNNYNDTSRIQINDSIRIMVDRYVRSDSVFYKSYGNLRHLGQITSPDSIIKIVTWNLVLSNGHGKFYCYIIRKGEKGESNRVYNLTSGYKENPVRTDTTYTESDWYGALYYDIRPNVTDNYRCWVLLGIDYGNPVVTRKIIEVLNFNPDGSIILGRKWFESGGKVIFREVFEYASNGTMSLRFSSDKSIVFDHLVPFSPSQKDNRQFYGPDYSTDGYNFADGRWKLSVNIDARNKE
jgi:hypothetical protein